MSLRTTERSATPRRYLMCPPHHFRSATPSTRGWTRTSPSTSPLALAQWEDLRDRYRALGHTVEELRTRTPTCPTWCSRRTAPPSSTAGCSAPGSPIRSAPARPRCTLAWFRAHGFTDVREPEHVNEGEGDFAVTASWLLAGRGFRSSPLSHAEAQEFFGRPVIGLDLVDPRYYHLDTALCVLDDTLGRRGHVLPGRVLARQPRGAGPALPRRADRRPRRTRRRSASTRSATAATCCCPRRRWVCSHPLRERRLRADRDGPERAAQGRRQREVLHPGTQGVLKHG